MAPSNRRGMHPDVEGDEIREGTVHEGETWRTELVRGASREGIPENRKDAIFRGSKEREEQSEEGKARTEAGFTAQCCEALDQMQRSKRNRSPCVWPVLMIAMTYHFTAVSSVSSISEKNGAYSGPGLVQRVCRRDISRTETLPATRSRGCETQLLGSLRLRLRGGARQGRSGGGAVRPGGLTFAAANGKSVDAQAARGVGKAQPRQTKLRRRGREEEEEEEDSIEFSDEEGGSSQDQYEGDFVSSGEESDEGPLDPKDELLDDSESAQFSSEDLDDDEEEEEEAPRRRGGRSAKAAKKGAALAVDPQELEKALKIMQMIGIKMEKKKIVPYAEAFITGLGLLDDKTARTAQLKRFLKACKAHAPFLSAVNALRYTPRQLLAMPESEMLAVKD